MRLKNFTLSKIIEIDSLGHMFKNLFFSNQYNPAHKSSHWEMLYVETNNVKAHTPKGDMEIKAGQAIFHEPGENHFHYNDSGQNAMIIDITFDTSSDYIKNLNGAIVTLTSSENLKIKELLDIAIIPEKGDYPNEDAVKRQYIKNTLELLLLDIIFTHLQNNNIYNTNKNYDIILSTLHANVYKPLKLQDIAKLCHLSESTVKQVFRTYHDEGIMSYFNKLKIKEIKYHITQGIPMGSISQSMSFSSQNYFSIFFKRETGMTPIEYRNSLKK